MFGKKLTKEKIKAIYDEAYNASDNEKAFEIVTPLVNAQAANSVAADALINLIENDCFSVDQSLALLTEIYQAHENDDELVISIGNAIEAACDIDFLNAPPPEAQLFKAIIDRLSELAESTTDLDTKICILEGLASTARLMARQYDELAEKSYMRLVELLPETAWVYYSLGLYFKTRGRFAEGVKANQKAIELAGESYDSYQWNLGICATGAGQGEVALKIWKEIGQKIEMGLLGLPEGGYPSCKVRLAERPLSQRSKDNDNPGLEETIWIERLSPCHGIIRSVLYQNLGVDYGDVILFDGAPITYHKYGDKQIAVFPHLATIKNSNYQFFDFAGTQSAERELSDLSSHLEKDAVLYSHTENFASLCSTCWRDENIDHEHREREEKNIVVGRIAVPPDQQPVEVLNALDKALQGKPENRIFSPGLCRAAGFDDRAIIEERRYQMLRNASK